MDNPLFLEKIRPEIKQFSCRIRKVRKLEKLQLSLPDNVHWPINNFSMNIGNIESNKPQTTQNNANEKSVEDCHGGRTGKGKTKRITPNIFVEKNEKTQKTGKDCDHDS